MNNLSVSFRLILLVAIGCAVSVLIGVIGWRGASMAIGSFDAVRHNELLHVRDLGLMADKYSNDIVDLTHKVRNRQMDWSQASQNLVEARRTIQEKWAAHPTSEMTGEEKALALEIEALAAKAAPELDRLKKILDARDRSGLEDFIDDTLYPTLDPMGDKLAQSFDGRI